MNEQKSDRVGRALRFIASDGYVVEDPEVVADWQDNVDRLVRLVADGAGGQAEARSLAAELVERGRLDLST